MSVFAFLRDNFNWYLEALPTSVPPPIGARLGVYRNGLVLSDAVNTHRVLLYLLFSVESVIALSK